MVYRPVSKAGTGEVRGRGKGGLWRPGQKRTEDLHQADLVLITSWIMRNGSMSVTDMIEELAKVREYKLSHETIRRDIEIIKAEWRKTYLQNMDDVMARELARIDGLESAYWEAWEASKEGIEVSYEDGGEQEILGGRGAGKKVVNKNVGKKTVGSHGEGEYLEGVRWCIEQRAKIWGLYAPVQNQIDIKWKEEALNAGVDPEQAKKVLVDILVKQMAANATDAEFEDVENGS